jgi:hypothetical protein
MPVINEVDVERLFVFRDSADASVGAPSCIG